MIVAILAQADTAQLCDHWLGSLRLAARDKWQPIITLPPPAPGVTGGHLVNDQHEDEAQHQSHAYQVLGGVLLLLMVTMGGCGSTVILVMVTSLVSHVQGLDTLGDDDREGGPQQQPRPQHTHQLREVTVRVTAVQSTVLQSNI